ncbi:hypothetical protein MMIC_P1318 [Mariprofundus micogutta]|uniref:DUF547 domain-containing protein n=1 Tax=Mariprofundus micogutta TaxID=1921010 RepID=A0A1L8CN81_9PROT|nr:DUF547 domain-containing protein [Mariprofundus micogutta]GAV20353.1 hypothetical protein MMIC_P1318 [Mariprofundus micogutta]
MRKLLFLCLLLASSINVQAAAFNHSDWDALLKKHVITVGQGEVTQVDYAGMAADRSDLKNYLSSLSATGMQQFESWPEQAQLAFLINAYNAWTIELILTAYPDIESIKELGSLFQSPWKKEFIPLLGEVRSLDDIEHGFIRAEGRYQNPYIHFAVNCASIGCPALLPEAYSAKTLDRQLKEATANFLRDRSRNRLEGQTLKISSIFKWYRQDFERGWEGFHSLEAFFSEHSESLDLSAADVKRLLAGDIEVEYLDYDWRLNGKRSR